MAGKVSRNRQSPQGRERCGGGARWFLSALAPGRQVAARAEGGAAWRGRPPDGRSRPVLPPFSPAGCGCRGAARHVDGCCRQLRHQGRGGGAGREEAAEGLLRLPRDQESAGRLVRVPAAGGGSRLGGGGGDGLWWPRAPARYSPSRRRPTVELLGRFNQPSARFRPGPVVFPPCPTRCDLLGVSAPANVPG